MFNFTHFFIIEIFSILGEISKQISTSGATAIITAAEIAPTVALAVKSILKPNAPFIVVDDGTETAFSGGIKFNVSWKYCKNLILFFYSIQV